MELIDRLKEVLKEEFNICSDEELLEAVQSMPELDLGIFVTVLNLRTSKVIMTAVSGTPPW